MAWRKISITLDSGETAMAQAPVIVSASRSTDIPGFYADWFFERLEKGYSAWTNPFNGVRSYVSYADTRFIVFWSKNPAPLIPHLEKLSRRGIRCYIQYTLNDYEDEGLERGVPPLDRRVETFRTLAGILGKDAVVWRFDPLILTDRISEDDLLRKIGHIGDRLRGYTRKLVFSFADISSYRRVGGNLRDSGVMYREWTEDQMDSFAGRLSQMNRDRGWEYELATCAEKAAFRKYGILPNRCVDDALMARLAYDDEVLMKFLGIRIAEHQEGLFGDEEIPQDAIELPGGRYAVRTKDNRDKGQRALCGCIVSKDIGEYNTCAHLCEYCYANTSKASARANLRAHTGNPHAETITGR